MFASPEYAQAGGLIAYGADLADGFRRAPVFVDRILKGARPGDLPIEQAAKVRVLVNLKTAKALGLTIPPAVLARADEIVEFDEFILLLRPRREEGHGEEGDPARACTV